MNKYTFGKYTLDKNLIKIGEILTDLKDIRYELQNFSSYVDDAIVDVEDFKSYLESALEEVKNDKND